MICNIRIILDSIFISVTLWIQMSYLLPIMIPWKIYFFANYLWHKSPFKRNYKTANEKLGNQKSLPIFFFLRIKMKRRREGEGFFVNECTNFLLLKTNRVNEGRRRRKLSKLFQFEQFISIIINFNVFLLFLLVVTNFKMKILRLRDHLVMTSSS